MRKTFLPLVVTLPALALAPRTQDPKTSPTDERAAVTIDDVAWLAGAWRGPGFGGECEEVWSEPLGPSMMGMFRHAGDDGRSTFYEFFTLVEAEGGLRLRLKHFTPDLVGWEEKAGFVEFPFVKLDEEGIWFEGLTYLHPDPQTLRVLVDVTGQGGLTRREELVLERMDG